ncbi:preprotein translocase subunit YajC [Rhodopirellula sp. MGV]|uniref:preprotein translocase subunit YajC n=1 Tax=Rhodopirellula sp. MGV TaxID=2023130 RepID=UPI000B961C58|nr:preprotein translocase subunit YajC [Rhodopirellula sp. MGV]OYP34687.1 preprotein translocase subunit YajC [Rhodopirellula sp. MGV]PNY34359.1 preprotein translocase subunit YajC [Rhodopirellula baltica]
MIQDVVEFVPKLMFIAEDAVAAEDQPLLIHMLEGPWILVIGFVAIFYFTYVMPEKRRKAEEVKRLAAITKGSRVVTVGGIHGTIVNASPESDVLTMKLDESGNVRVKVSRWALTVLDEKKAKDSEPSKD